MNSAEARRATASLADRYRVLLDIGRTLSGTLSQDELFRAIYRETGKVVEAAGFYIALYDQSRDLATIVFYADRGEERHVEISFRGSDSEVIRTGKGSTVQERSGVSTLLVLGSSDTELTRSAVSAPLLHKGRVLGSISAQSYRPNAYGTQDLELLQGIADIAAVALDNARHVAELERQRHEAEQIEAIGRAVVASLEAEEVLGRVAEAALSVLNADGAAVWCFEDDGHTVRVDSSTGDVLIPVGTRWDIAGPLLERLVSKRQAVVIDDLGTSRLVPEEMRVHLEGGTGIAVPLVVGDRVRGLLTAGTRTVRGLSAEDVSVLDRIAGQAAVALQNADLHQSVQELTLIDPLCEVPNRRHLRIHLEHETAAARRGRALALVIFDLDDFKRYNDTLGHVVGDEILCAFAEALEIENRAMNLVSRYGGDEFVSVLSESDEEGSLYYVDRVRERMQEIDVLARHGVSVSCGIAIFDPETMKTPEDLLEAADTDLYRRKAERR